MNVQGSNSPKSDDPSEPLVPGASPDPAHCPLCGQPNRCAMEVEKETGLKQAPCWCTGVAFAPSVLAQIPAASRGLACVCVACTTRPENPIKKPITT